MTSRGDLHRVIAYRELTHVDRVRVRVDAHAQVTAPLPRIQRRARSLYHAQGEERQVVRDRRFERDAEVRCAALTVSKAEVLRLCLDLEVPTVFA